MNCGEPMADDAIAAPHPLIIVEVFSPGTASTDTGGKLADDFRIPSVAHTLVVHPTVRTVTHHRRTDAGIDTTIVVNGPILMAPGGSLLPWKKFTALNRMSSRTACLVGSLGCRTVASDPERTIRRVGRMSGSGRQRTVRLRCDNTVKRTSGVIRDYRTIFGVRFEIPTTRPVHESPMRRCRSGNGAPGFR